MSFFNLDFYILLHLCYRTLSTPLSSDKTSVVFPLQTLDADAPYSHFFFFIFASHIEMDTSSITFALLQSDFFFLNTCRFLFFFRSRSRNSWRKSGWNGRNKKGRSSRDRRRNSLVFNTWRPADASRRRSCGGWRRRRSVPWSSSARRKSCGRDCSAIC